MRRSLMFILEAQELLSAGKLKQAAEVCKRGLAYYPDHVSGYLFLSQAFVGLGQTQRAMNVLRDGFRRTGAPKLEDMRRQLAGEAPLPHRIMPEPIAATEPQGQPTTDTTVNGHESSVAQPEAEAPMAPEAQPETVTEPVAEPVTETVAEPVAEPVTESVAEPVTESVAEPVTESVAEPVAESVAEPVAESVAEPVTEPVAEPVTEPVAEPVTEPVAETVAESVGESVAEPVAGQPTHDVTQAEEPPPPIEQREQLRPLVIHTTQSSKRLRSANLRLIPGLEFAPLRHSAEEPRQHIRSLIEEPSISRGIPKITSPKERAPKTEQRVPRMIIPERPSTDPRSESADPLTPLEELARQLENARIPILEDQEQRQEFDSPIVSETLADILVSQKAYAEALKAFQTLERTKPARAEYFRQKIGEVQAKMDAEPSPAPKSDPKPDQP